MSERHDDWIQTYTGRQFWPLDPRVEDIDIRDIAHALSMKCRYGGHSLAFYSVAEHSIFVSRALPPELRLTGLLHDAAEAYLADIPRPVKPLLAGFKEIEERIERVIAEVFGLLPPPWPDAVKAADTAILHDETRALMGEAPAPWNIPGESLGVRPCMWPHWYAERVFLGEFKRLVPDWPEAAA